MAVLFFKTSHFNSTDRILILGGSGFIGQHLINRCLLDTPHVTCLGLHESQGQQFIKNPATRKACDITSQQSVIDILRGNAYEYVFNLCGFVDHTPYFKGGRRVIDAHFGGLLNVLDNLDQKVLKSFVQVGSSDEYGELVPPQVEHMQGDAFSPYSVAKKAGTALVSMLAEREEFPGVVVRLFLVYGPGQNQQRFIPQVITSCLRNEHFPVTKGDQLRDFCYVEDVVDALVRAALAEKARGQVINIASGNPTTVRKMIEKIVTLVGQGTPMFGARPYRPGESMALYADITKAKQLLDWSPLTDIDIGLRKTITYYQEQLELCKS